MGFRGSGPLGLPRTLLFSTEPTSAAVGVHFGVHFLLQAAPKRAELGTGCAYLLGLAGILEQVARREEDLGTLIRYVVSARGRSSALEIGGFGRFCARGRSPALVGDVTGFVTALF